MIIDTMVMAYALLSIPGFYRDSLAALDKADRLEAPASFHAELVNVFWQWIGKGVTMDEALQKLSQAERLLDTVIPIVELWEDALQLSIETKHPPYDTLFIVAAKNRGTRVLTYDKKMLTLFPKDTVNVADFLSGK